MGTQFPLILAKSSIKVSAVGARLLFVVGVQLIEVVYIYFYVVPEYNCAGCLFANYPLSHSSQIM